MTIKKRVVFPVILLCVCAAVILVCCEILLRVTGHTPWRYGVLDRNEPTVHEPDSILGWRNKKGSYTIPPYLRGGEAIHLTFLEHGRRATGRLNRDGRKKLILVGGSFTQG